VPYNCPAVTALADTAIAGAVDLGVEVYYTADPTVP
jgi:hypothetical protein